MLQKGLFLYQIQLHFLLKLNEKLQPAKYI
jgi:hypothetical protein